MKKICIIILSVFLLSCNTNTNKKPAYKNPKLDIERRTSDLLSRMTLEEKFWQLFMIPGDLSDGKERYKHGIFGLQVATKGQSGNEAEQLLDYSGGGAAVETARCNGFPSVNCISCKLEHYPDG